MAGSVLRTPTNSSTTLTATPSSFIKSHLNTITNNKFLCVSFALTHPQISFSQRCRVLRPTKHPLPSRKFSPLASFSNGEAASAAAAESTAQAEVADEVLPQQPDQLEENSDGAFGSEETASESDVADVEEPTSMIKASLQLYREALASNDESKVVEIEDFLKSIEDEKISLEQKLASISEQLSYEKERVLRISADFDNFRKRTERERLSLVTNAQGEVVETLLPVVDNFERAKTQIKVETEQEQKINNSYQSIYKQFVEILGSLGVTPVETVGKPFDPLLHEAIMREDSTEFEEGFVIEEYRKGFQLGDRLLRPSMVKVSAGPGPAKSEPSVEPTEQQIEGEDDATESGEASAELKSAEE